MKQPHFTALAMCLVVAITGSLNALPATATILSGAEPGSLARPGQTKPADLGEDALDGLQFADPKENLDLIAPPEAGQQGGANLTHPLTVPAGRAGVEPALSLVYDSTGGNGWVGTGWDLGLGSVEVDTRWGSPLFCPAAGELCDTPSGRNVESETYVLDGDQLSPTAVRYPFAARVANKSDWTRRVETEWERIIRHGDSPKNYWWEVTDKNGTTRYYGGTPEGNRDAGAILTDADDNAVRWGLSGVRDISSNIMRVSYDKPAGAGVGSADASVGTGFYVRSIRYTGSLAGSNPDDPAYEVVFLRDGDFSPVPGRRPDVVVDAAAGALEVTSDLLRRIEVRHGTGNAGSRAYGELVKGWNLVYAPDAPFGKSLLEKVEQFGTDGVPAGSHTFTYYDDVKFATGTYDGFAGDASWTSGDGDRDDLHQSLLSPVGLSALGASESNNGEGHAYLGFNLTEPSKTGSFGGAFSVGGGGTDGLIETLDMNGDLLPDKVFRTNITGSPVKYRLNNGDGTFGPAKDVIDLDSLSSENSFSVSGGPEVYFGVSVQFNIASDITTGEQYFTDVNNDGLPDFVSSGTVYFNTPTATGPKFTKDSGGTPVPIDDGTVNLDNIQALADFEALQRSLSPRQDVVRRWVAPFAGTVSITGTATLDAGHTGDGVRLAIQHGSDELWAANLLSKGASVTPTEVTTVGRGEAIYFRVGSVDDGATDLVHWSPVVTYTSLGTPATDANGLSQTVFRSVAEFTPAGRPDTPVLVPLRGTVRVEGTLTKSAPTSDDLRLLVLHNGATVSAVPVAAGYVGDIALDTSFTVAAPSGDSPDKVVVRVAADSPIDPTTLSFAPRLYYTEAFDGTTPIDVTADLDNDGQDDDPTLELNLPWDIDLYPNTDDTAPRAPWASTLGREVSVKAAVSADLQALQRDVTLTVKQRTASGIGEVVAKRTFQAGVLGGSAQVDGVTLTSGADYWFDLTVRDPDLSEHVTGADVTLAWSEDGTSKTLDVPETLNWAGRQGIFPIAHRGWAYAGYNADFEGRNRSTTPLEEQAFVFQQSDYPTTKPTGFNDTSYKDPAQGESYPFTSQLVTVVGKTGKVPAWRGVKDSLAGGADFTSSSRTGVDSIGVSGAPGSGAGVRAVTRVGRSGEVFGLVAGFGPLTASFAAGPSYGLLDYVDLNGDSFPDVVTPDQVTYTTPRGGFLPGHGAGPEVVGKDTTYAVGGGFNGTAIDVKGNSKGDANTAQDTASTSGTAKKPTTSGSAQQGEPADTQESGVNVGGSLGVTAQFTNPGSLHSDWGDSLSQMDLGTGDWRERELADVNGDSLPDLVFAGDSGVWVRFNLGHSFSGQMVKWAGGAFENGESYSGSVGPLLGFNYNKKEFSAGLSFNEGIDQARYSWVDVDGDGVPDRVRKDGDGTKVAFASGSGARSEVDYGDMVEGTFDLIGAIPLGQQASQDRSRGLGGGFDFMIPIGPLCPPVGCYIIVNPGASYDRSLSSSQVQLTDVNGDGSPDSVLSSRDGAMTVRANNRGRTNLLKSVTNPLGGEIRLGYTRDGNTTEQPLPLWLMTSVEVDDHRPGDGPVQVSTFGYQGNRFDKVERELMGYRTIVEEQRDGAVDAAVLRRVVSTYGNSTVFDSGLLERQEMQAPDGTPVSRTTSTWLTTALDTFAPTIPLATSDPVPVPTNGSEALALLDDSRGVVRTQVVQSWFDPAGNLGTSLRSTFEYDALGNAVRQVDHGQEGDPNDDLEALTTYPDCRSTSWVGSAGTFTVRDHAGVELRRRDGSTDLCLNAVPIHIEERIDDTTTAMTDLTFDAWGNYNQVAYPENADHARYVVDYVYDADRHTDVAEVTDSHGLTARASFSPAGLVTERVDANGNATRYTYDAFNRLSTVRSPNEQDPAGPPTVAYEYAPTASGYGYALARHHDRFNPGDTIDTVAFVDGVGRVTQTKRDFTFINDDPTLPGTDQVLVSGAIAYDALGRQVKEWWPTIEPLGTLTTFQATRDPYQETDTAYTLLDQVSRVALPNGDDGSDLVVTTIDHGFGTTQGTPAGLFVTTTTDPIRHDSVLAGETPLKGKQQVTYTDVRGNLLVTDDIPGQGDPIRTRYGYDRLGQLTEVVDNAQNRTTHTWDGLGRRLSTQTPDGGLHEMSYDPAGNVVSETTPNLRARGLGIAYRYDIDRLTLIDYPDATPDVSYTYGAPGAPHNGAGRVVGVEDGARSQTLAYDALGNVATEVTTTKVHNLNPQTRDKLTFTTGFSYDSLGRIDKLTYPDGEVLSHDYDSGGQLTAMQGAKQCTQLGTLASATTADATTITVIEVAASTPTLPFTIRLDGEQLRVVDRVPAGAAGQFLYTVERGINGSILFPTAAPHAAGTKVVSDVAVTCSYRYLDRQEYDQFDTRRQRGTGNGVTTQWGFDWLGRLEVIATDTPTRNVQNLTYTYDKANNVTSMVNEVPAAQPSQYVGPSAQNYTYDPYYRLSGATGSADVAPDKVREISLALTYDQHGNVTTKAQTDRILKQSGKGKPQLPSLTNYTFTLQYGGAGPHQLTRNGSRSYTWDANGNLQRWFDSVTNETRTMTWDAEDRITRIDDGKTTTDYVYDSDGRLAIERGPDGETSFVNRWYTVREGAVPWKHVWAGDDRMAAKRSFNGDYEHQQYFLAKDLQGSTNVVTDDTGKVFQHWEYLPGGEPWIREDSNVHRTPYLFAGGYLDEVRRLVNLGRRWYEPREGMFYSPDPMLHSDPSAVQGDPALLPAYSYAESSPLRLVDTTGLASSNAGSALSSNGIKAAPPSASDAGVRTDTNRGSRLWAAVGRVAATPGAKKLQAFSERFEMKPLIEVNLVKTADGWQVKDVKASAFIGFSQKTVYKGAGDRNGADDSNDSTNPSLGGQGNPQPGAGTPALANGPASVGAAGSGDDAGTGSLGGGVAATGPSGVSGVSDDTRSRAGSLSDSAGDTSSRSRSASTASGGAGSVDGPPDSAGV